MMPSQGSPHFSALPSLRRVGRSGKKQVGESRGEALGEVSAGPKTHSRGKSQERGSLVAQGGPGPVMEVPGSWTGSGKAGKCPRTG